MGQRNPLPLDQLQVPDEHKMNEVLDALTDAGRTEFLREMLDAVSESARMDDLSPLQFTINAWWASGTFTRHPRFMDAVEAAQKSSVTDKQYDARALEEFLAPA